MAIERRTGIVILAGLPGAGKTLLAKALASRLGGVVLSKDEVRAALFPEGAITYSSKQDDFCMSLILKAIHRIVADGGVPFIFLDGRTFSRTRQVNQVVRAAAKAGAEVNILYLHCPELLALERIKEDKGKHAAKNRDQQLYLKVKSRFQPITLPKLDVDTSQPLEECVAKCIEYLTTETPRH